MNASDIYAKDILAQLVIGKLKVKPIYVVILIYILAAIHMVLLLIQSLPNGVTQEEMIRIMEAVVWEWMFDPAFAYFYLSFPAFTADMFQSFDSNRYLDVDLDDLEMVKPYYRSTWRLIISLGAGIIWPVHFIYTRAFEIWQGEMLLFTIYGAVFSFFGGIILGNLLYTAILNVFVVNKLIKGKLMRLHILASDKCGGFKALRDYAVRITSIIFIGGVVLVFTQYKYITLGLTSEIWYQYILNPIFIIVGTLGFFAPMYRAHKEMERGKKELLDTISEEINKIYYKIVGNKGVDKDDLRQRNDDLNELEELYGLTEKFPDWPFDVGALRSYLASIATPLLAVIVNILQSVLGDLLFS